MKKIQSVNPYNGKVLKEYSLLSSEDIQSILSHAHQQFYSWRDTSFSQRSKLIMKVREILLINKNKYARVMTIEMGKPITQAIAEVEKCAWLCEYYAKLAPIHLQPEEISTDATKSFVTYEPLGVILAVMPWNYPFWQVFRFAVPALMAGNIAVLKHASNVPESALLLEELFLEAGFPKYCFSTLLISNNQVEEVIKNKVIKAVTLTGSEKAGASVAGIAGNQLKKTVLELGGSNALIVLPDCNIEATVKTCIQARFQNTGQSCIAGKRLLLSKSIAKEFLAKLKKELQLLISGNPENTETYLGVLAREDLAIALEQQVNKSLEMGASLLTGGRRDGAYYQPTVVTDVTPQMPVFNDETFGPVLAVTLFDGLQEAIDLSNASKYGLGVSIFTQNIESILSQVNKFDEGAVFINELVKSDPRLPFGGIKQSGYGRELSKQGIREFINIKTVYVK